MWEYFPTFPPVSLSPCHWYHLFLGQFIHLFSQSTQFIFGRHLCISFRYKYINAICILNKVQTISYLFIYFAIFIQLISVSWAKTAIRCVSVWVSFSFTFICASEWHSVLFLSALTPLHILLKTFSRPLEITRREVAKINKWQPSERTKMQYYAAFFVGEI